MQCSQHLCGKFVSVLCVQCTLRPSNVVVKWGNVRQRGVCTLHELHLVRSGDRKDTPSNCTSTAACCLCVGMPIRFWGTWVGRFEWRCRFTKITLATSGHSLARCSPFSPYVKRSLALWLRRSTPLHPGAFSLFSPYVKRSLRVHRNMQGTGRDRRKHRCASRACRGG